MIECFIDILLYHLQKICNAHTTSGYIINGKNNIKELRNCFYSCIEPLQQGKPENIWAIDCKWHELQKNSNWYCFKGQLGTQIPSYSDIQKKLQITANHYKNILK